MTRGGAAHTVMATLFYLHKHQVARKEPQLALEARVMLTSMRRSTFADKAALARFLLQLMDGTYAVLAQQQHLGHAECFHQFCRLPVVR